MSSAQQPFHDPFDVFADFFAHHMATHQAAHEAHLANHQFLHHQQLQQQQQQQFFHDPFFPMWAQMSAFQQQHQSTMLSPHDMLHQQALNQHHHHHHRQHQHQHHHQQPFDSMVDLSGRHHHQQFAALPNSSSSRTSSIALPDGSVQTTVETVREPQRRERKMPAVDHQLQVVIVNGVKTTRVVVSRRHLNGMVDQTESVSSQNV
jgi:hypothetical protein